jgi:hypothetical protein
MTVGAPTVEGRNRSDTNGPDSDLTASVLKLGAVVSPIQSGLFVVIGIAALALGVDRLVDNGFASLRFADPTAFRVLCVAFVLIAVLGLAITAAERALIEPSNAGLARFGAVLAYLGHAGTIAFFSWWLIQSFADVRSGTDLDVVAPIEWGVMFELVFVGAWVWIIAAVMRGQPSWPAGFVVLSVVKATSFWFAFIAFLTDEKWMIVLGLGAVTFFTGPWWHLWIPRLFKRSVREPAHAR